MARLMALCSLPRTNPGKRKEYKRVNGSYTLIMLSCSTKSEWVKECSTKRDQRQRSQGGRHEISGLNWRNPTGRPHSDSKVPAA